MTKMNLKKLLLATAILASGVIAAAQDSFDMHVADIGILQDKAVQKELGVTEAQRKQMNVHAQTHRSRLMAYEKQLESQAKKSQKPVAPDQAKLRSYYAELKKNVLSELKANQLKRLRELTLQRLGMMALMDGVVAKKVGMTDAQLKKLRDTYTAGNKEVARLQQQAAGPIIKEFQSKKPANDAERKKLQEQFNEKMKSAGEKVRPQLQAVHNSTQKKMLAVLTKKNQDTYIALQGKLFRPA